jgi:hypothetical protein
MRSGGEADKLANRYEGLWTTYQLFDVLRGDALSLTPEPLEDGVGGRVPQETAGWHARIVRCRSGVSQTI